MIFLHSIPIIYGLHGGIQAIIRHDRFLIFSVRKEKISIMSPVFPHLLGWQAVHAKSYNVFSRLLASLTVTAIENISWIKSNQL